MSTYRCKACGCVIHVTKRESHPCEYLRRNTLVSSAHGIKAQTEVALDRLARMRKPPKWMVKALREIQARITGMPGELAKYRNQERSTER